MVVVFANVIVIVVILDPFLPSRWWNPVFAILHHRLPLPDESRRVERYLVHEVILEIRGRHVVDVEEDEQGKKKKVTMLPVRLFQLREQRMEVD